MLRLAWIVFVIVTATSAGRLRAEENKVTFEKGEDSIRISIGSQTIAEYVFRDEQIWRPYFRHLRTRSGVLVTRQHPPVKGQDLDDHATMHPGLWLAFGDINGFDFWRNKGGRIRHVRFVKEPSEAAGVGSFVVENIYEANGKAICTEECKIAISIRRDGYLIDWQSTFLPQQHEIRFGDQEEMGLGVRVATPLAVVKGGQLVDSEGRKNEEQVWGQQANWCQYSGVQNGKQIGMVLTPDPTNFRRSWFHARNYGLLVANPFGQKAFTKGEKSSITVKPGEQFRLRYGVLVFERFEGIQPIYDPAGPNN
jgi:hypothetical protein